SAFGPIAKLKSSNAAAPKTKTAKNCARDRHCRRNSLRSAISKCTPRNSSGGQAPRLSPVLRKVDRRGRLSSTGARSYDPTRLQRNRLIRKSRHVLELMRRDHHGRAARTHLAHGVIDQRETFRIELSVRFG